MQNSNDTQPILIELTARGGAIDVGLDNHIERLAERSSEALGNALKTIKDVATKVADTANSIKLSERPDKIEIEFGLELDTEGNAIIAKAGAKVNLTVRMAWSQTKED